MKKIVAIVIASIMLVFNVGCAANACYDDSYMALSKISAIEDKTDYNNPDADYELVVTSITTDGNIFQWLTDDTSWNVGDNVILHILSNGTWENKTDDSVCCVQYVKDINL